jgi:hypothetical protein
LNNQVPQLVATPAEGHSAVLVLSMDGTGNLTGSWSENGASNWKTAEAQFINEHGTITSQHPDVNLTSIAINHNGGFYGIMEDGTGIVEYSWDSSAPYNLTWAQNITIS